MILFHLIDKGLKMKINVEIDLDDILYDLAADGEGDISEMVKGQIIREAAGIILPKIKEGTKSAIKEKLDGVANKMMENIVSKEMDKVLNKGVISIGGRDLTIEDYIKDLFETNHGWRNPQDQIKKIAKSFGDELKSQYNSFFATQIVVNMKEQGLLKDGVAQMLLDNSTDKG